MDYNTIKDLWFYDFQNILESYRKILEERNKEEEKQAKQQGYDKSKFTPDSVSKTARGMMPSFSGGGLPKIGGFKL